MNEQERLKMIKKLRWWTVKIPDRINKMTPKEIYLEAFHEGYACKISELKMEDFPIFEFREVKN
jgi:hypothetical protein